MATTRGTTPSHVFIVDIDLTTAEVLYITYEQDGHEVLEKDINSVDIETDRVTVKLTQEETLSLKAQKNVEIQIRARYPDGTAVASNIINTSAKRILKEGEI